MFELLNEILETMMLDLKRPFLAALTEDIHVLPDFHGNRYMVIDQTLIQDFSSKN